MPQILTYMKLRNIVVLFLTLLTIACSSGKKAYEHGNYYEAVLQSVKRLRQKPDHEKSSETLQNSYPLAVEYLESQAANEIASNSNFKWKNVIQYYNQINHMYEEVRQCPACMRIVKNPKNYYSEMNSLKEKAAEESYGAGLSALNKGTRNDAKQAYYYFQDVQSFVQGYKDVVSYIDKAREMATLKVVVEQIPVPARYNLSGGFFQDKVEEYLHTNYPERTFVRFFTPKEANNVGLQNADQYLRIQFDDFSVGNTILKEKEETFTKDSVKVGDAKINGKTVPVYNTVKARLTTFRKEVISSGLLSMVIVDAHSQGILSHSKFEGNYVWGCTWGNFNGDDRALTQEQLNWCKQKELMPPQPQDLFLQFTKPIYDQLIPAIQGFYKNY
jgi:hypothetical protein